MSTSLVYRSAIGYDLVMWALYRRHHAARLRCVADLIPPFASVLELACGPGFLYERHLRAKCVTYVGIDVNPRFVRRVCRLGGTGLVQDLRQDNSLPIADYVLMQASLYHFLPSPDTVLDRMEAAARRQVIIAEPIHNLATSPIRLLATLARHGTNPGGAPADDRFDELRLDSLMSARRHPPRCSFLIPGGREKVYVTDAAASIVCSAGQ